MRIDLFGRPKTWRVNDDKSLEAALAWRDDRGGGAFFLAPDQEEYPLLLIRISGDVADVQYYPQDEHPGFRCLGGDGLPEGGTTRLVYEGCDPADGEEEHNDFIVPTKTALAVAREFFGSQQLPKSVLWFEL